MKTETNPSNEAKGKVRVSKMVVIKLMDDGSSQVSSLESNAETGLELRLTGGTVVTSKDFKELPKRLSFFFEKGFNH